MKAQLENACATIIARELHEEASRVAEEYMDGLEDTDEAEAETKLEELQTLLHNLAVDHTDIKDIFGATDDADKENDADEEELQRRRDGVLDTEPELLGWVNPCQNEGDREDAAPAAAASIVSCNWYA